MSHYITIYKKKKVTGYWQHATHYNNHDLAKSTKAHHKKSTSQVSLHGNVCTSDDLWCCLHLYVQACDVLCVEWAMEQVCQLLLPLTALQQESL